MIWLAAYAAGGALVGFLAGLLGIGGGHDRRCRCWRRCSPRRATRTTTSSTWRWPPQWPAPCSTSAAGAREHHKRRAVDWNVVKRMALTFDRHPRRYSCHRLGAAAAVGAGIRGDCLRCIGADGPGQKTAGVARPARCLPCSASAPPSAWRPGWSPPAAHSCRCRSWCFAACRYSRRSAPARRSTCRFPSWVASAAAPPGGTCGAAALQRGIHLPAGGGGAFLPACSRAPRRSLAHRMPIAILRRIFALLLFTLATRMLVSYW